jgi:hypothetical protein
VAGSNTVAGSLYILQLSKQLDFKFFMGILRGIDNQRLYLSTAKAR